MVHACLPRTGAGRAVVVNGQHHGASSATFRSQSGRNAQPVQQRHFHVQDYYVGIHLVELVPRFDTVGGFAEHVQIRFELEPRAEAAANRGMVVYDQDSDRRA
jgi:hypothetical protein